MRAVWAAMAILAVVSMPRGAQARGHQKPAADPFGELFAQKPAKAAVPRHAAKKQARRHRKGARVRLTAAVVATVPVPMLVASNAPFQPEVFAPGRHALAGP